MLAQVGGNKKRPQVLNVSFRSPAEGRPGSQETQEMKQN